jgi:hypothetical protein
MIDNILNAALCLCLLVGSTAAIGSAWQVNSKPVAAASQQQLVASAATAPAPQALR